MPGLRQNFKGRIRFLTSPSQSPIDHAMVLSSSICQLLLLLHAAGTVVAEQTTPQPKTVQGQLHLLKLFRGGSGDGFTSTTNKQDVLVIGAGFGRTATSSYLEALDRLGLKSYNMKAVFETPGHAAMWRKHADLLLEEKSEEGNMDEIVEMLAKDGFNATASMPACNVYNELMDRYPEAKVVLTVRSEEHAGDAWADSLINSVMQVFPLSQKAPLKWLPALQHQQRFLNWVFQDIGAPLNPETRTSNRQELVKAYSDWIERVKADVPPENLLIFAAKDGWQPLCDFLSPLKPPIHDRCQEILTTGVPYPRVNERASTEHLFRFLGIVVKVFEILPFFLAFIVIVVVYRWRKRNGNTGSVKEKND